MGTVGRLCLAILLLYLAFIVYGVDATDLALGLVVFPGVLVVLQRARLTRTTGAMDATGPAEYIANLVLALLLHLYPPTTVATLLFYGVSLLVAALRGYAGCEVLAIGNWLLKRDDQVGCVVLSPVDAWEARAGGGSESG